MDPSHTARITRFSNTHTHILSSQKLLGPAAHQFWLHILFFPLAELHKTSTRDLPGKTSAHTILHLITPKLPAEILLCSPQGCSFGFVIITSS